MSWLGAPPPPFPSGGRYPTSGNPGFPGRGLGPERAARERAQPLGSAEHVGEANALRATRCVGIGEPAAATLSVGSGTLLPLLQKEPKWRSSD